MDNRDYKIICPFYRPGSKNHTKNPRVIGKRKRTIHCQNDENGMPRLSMEFQTIEERTEHCRAFCKQNVNGCPIHKVLAEERG